MGATAYSEKQTGHRPRRRGFFGLDELNVRGLFKPMITWSRAIRARWLRVLWPRTDKIRSNDEDLAVVHKVATRVRKRHCLTRELAIVHKIATQIRNRHCLTKDLSQFCADINTVVGVFRFSLVAVEQSQTLSEWDREFRKLEARFVSVLSAKAQLTMAMALASIDDWYFRLRETPGISCEEVKRFGLVVLWAVLEGNHCTCSDCVVVWSSLRGLRGELDEERYAFWVAAEWQKYLDSDLTGLKWRT
ncbi:hypothetical protein M0657_011783 [Pyricularia oryzae]|nr:hypothetical protein M0657_011783 [Pyricularia oryzae]